jgi:hypothetical protein
MMAGRIGRTGLGAVAGVALVAAWAFAMVPARASAAGRCPTSWTARIVSEKGAGQVLVYGRESPAGAPLRGHTLRWFHFYEVQGKTVTFRYGANRYTAGPGAIFDIQCYAETKGDPKFPAVSLLSGTLRVRTSKAKAGGVVTEEGLYGPVPGQTQAMAYTVTRKPSSTSLSLWDKLNWFAGYGNQPTGTTTVTAVGRPRINVTPYVGERPGSCRHCKQATLTTRGSFGRGDASYGGLGA